MLKRDYIMRLMQQFFETLEKLLEERKRKPESEIRMRINGLYEAYFHRPQKFFQESSGEDIVKYLLQEFYMLPDGAEEADIRQAQNDLLYRMEMLADLLYHDIEISADEQSVVKGMCENTLYILEHIDARSSTFSFERRKRIDELNSK